MKPRIYLLATALALSACGDKAKNADTTPPPNPADGTATAGDGSATDTTAKPEEKPAPPAPDPAATYLAECTGHVNAAKKILPTIVAVQGEHTVNNTLVPYNELLRNLDLADASSGLMQAVHPDEKVREAARECEKVASKFHTELSLDQDLYKAISAVATKGLDADTARMVEHNIRDFKRAGVDKDEATRAKIKALNEELTDVGQAFQKQIADDVRTVELDPKDLQGMPDDYIKAHPPGKNGKVTITTDYPDYIPFMEYAVSGPAKKAIYLQFRSRGGEANEKNLKRIIEIRWELAKILGYKNWADYITEDKMMKSGKNAAKFIARVVKIAKKRGKKDYAELLAAKRKDDPKAKVVEDWEKTYYAHKVKEAKYSYDSQSVRPYFEFEKVEKGLLDITSRMYGIEYKRVPNDVAKVWDPSVKAYDVLRDGAKIGRIYLDMHPREGKYKHAAQFTLKTGVKGEQLPEGALVTNLPDPAKSDGPALMEHDDVVTMFHEFGHLMHHILGGQQRWIQQSGVATEWDFVEAPSQMFEEWAWRDETLSLFAKNAKGEVIPKELVAKMRKAKDFGLGTDTLQQMFYASISLNFYSIDPKKLDMRKEVVKLQKKYTPFRPVPGTMFEASFGHLYGYSAQYYTYMWSLVIAKDMFTPFEKNGLLNPEWTHRYRDKILAPGGTKDAADLVADFLGRPFNYKAFEKYLGG